LDLLSGRKSLPMMNPPNESILVITALEGAM